MSEKFGLTFQKDLVNLILRDSKFFALIKKYLKVEFFTSKNLRTIYQFVLEYYEKYGYLPNKTALYNNFKKEPLTTNLIKKIYNLPVVHKEYIVNSLEEFFKRNIFIRYYNISALLYNEKKYQDSYDVMTDGMHKINLVTVNPDRYQFLIKGFNNRMIDRIIGGENINDFIIPSGIPKLDRLTGGGIRNTKVGLVIGDAKSGKSTFLRYVGLSAVKRYIAVLHIQLEDTMDEVMTGYDSALLKQTYYDVKAGRVDERDVKRVLKKIKERKSKDLIISAFTDWDSCTIQDIDDLWLDLFNQGIYCQLVLIDYLDLMKSRRNYNEERFRQTSIARDIKSFAIKRNVAVWTGTQTHRLWDKEDPEFVITGDNVGEDYGKIRVVDLPVSINHTNEEYKKGLARIHICPGRITKGGYTFKINQDLGNGLFYVHK